MHSSHCFIFATFDEAESGNQCSLVNLFVLTGAEVEVNTDFGRVRYHESRAFGNG